MYWIIRIIGSELFDIRSDKFVLANDIQVFNSVQYLVFVQTLALQQIKNIGDVLKADSKTVPERNDRGTQSTCVVKGFITIVYNSFKAELTKILLHGG